VTKCLSGETFWVTVLYFKDHLGLIKLDGLAVNVEVVSVGHTNFVPSTSITEI